MKQISHGPSGWLAYVEVDDIGVAIRRAKLLSAEIMKDVTEVAGWVVELYPGPDRRHARTVAQWIALAA